MKASLNGERSSGSQLPMETPYTDENRIEEIHQHVEEYLKWLRPFEGSWMKDQHYHEVMRIRPRLTVEREVVF